MRFSEIPYARPDVRRAERIIRRQTRRLRFSFRYAGFSHSFWEASGQMQGIATARALAEIRHALDADDAFYERELAFFDAALPRIAPAYVSFCQTALKSRFAAGLAGEYGLRLLELCGMEAQRFNERLTPLMDRERRLAAAYQKLLSSCDIELLGRRRTLPDITALLSDADRSVRKRAYDAYASFFEAREETLDALFDKLVRVRDELGKRAGFDSFTPLAYQNLGRTDYGPADVAVFREQVKSALVAPVEQVRRRQGARIGVEKLAVYDEPVLFPDGNAATVGAEAELAEQAYRVFSALSEQTGEFFHFMRENEQISLTALPGKAAGAYVAILPDYRVPFLFANVCGDGRGVDALICEAGRAFQAYRRMQTPAANVYWESSGEISESLALATAFFAYPHMEHFFGADAGKYRFRHSQEALTYAPTAACADEFQQRIYDQPDLSPEERKRLWREMEHKYLPFRDYGGKSVFMRGGFFHTQTHIYLNPFRCMEGALARMSAFDLYGRMQRDREGAFSDYLRLCDAGGRFSYRQALKNARLPDPFAPGSVKQAVAPLLFDLDICHQDG